MKKTLSAILCVTALLLSASCEKDDTLNTFGDYSVRSQLELIPQVVSIHGDTIPLIVSRSIDTTYRYFRTEEDTIKDEAGEPLLDASGNLQFVYDTIWSYGTTGRFTEYELVELPSQADTFSISLRSNAQWKAPVPSTGGKVQWFYNYNVRTGTTSTAGGGDGWVDFRVTRNKNKRRSVVAVQDIYTNDSSAFVRLHFAQRGEKDAN